MKKIILLVCVAFSLGCVAYHIMNSPKLVEDVCTEHYSTIAANIFEQ